MKWENSRGLYAPRHEKTCFMTYANNKGADQPAHPRSLISTFVVRCLYSTISVLAKSKSSSLQLVSVAEQAGLSLTWSKPPKTDFLVTRLIWDNASLASARIPTRTLFLIMMHKSYEPAYEIMALFVLRKLILQTPMRSHPVGLDIWFSVRHFVYFHITCVRTAKALARLRGCAGSSEPSLVAYMISTQSHELAHFQ